MKNNKIQIRSIEMQPFEKEAIDKLKSPLHREIMTAKFGKKVAEYSENTNMKQCEALVREIFLQTGSNHSGNEEMIKLTSKLLFNELLSFASMFTWLEVKSALLNGIRKEFGEYFGLSQVSFHQFLKGYKNWHEKIEAAKDYNKVLDEPKTTDKPMTDMFLIKESDCIDVFEEYKKTKSLPVLAWLHYDFMKSKNMFNWSQEVMDEYKKKAKLEHEKQLKHQRKSGLISATKFSEIMAIPLESNRMWVNIGKRMLLAKYFDNLIENKQDLKFYST